VGLGFYLKWFEFSTSSDPETGRTGLQFNINKNKIKSDTDKAKQKITGKATPAKDKPAEQ
jgi:hypothetical protein